MVLAQNSFQKSLLTHSALAGFFVAWAIVGRAPHETTFSLPLEIDLFALERAASMQKPAHPAALLASSKAPVKAPTEASLEASSVSPATNSDATAASGIKAEKTYLSELRSWIEQHKRYPPQAKTLGHEGRSEVRFKILSDGTVSSVELLKSSGSSILDQAALALLQQVRKLSPFPESMNLGSLDLVLPIEYSLN